MSTTLDELFESMSKKEKLAWKRIIYCEKMLKTAKKKYYFIHQINKSILILRSV